MRVYISLNGINRGFIHFMYQDDKLIIKQRGIPPESKIFVVCGNTPIALKDYVGDLNDIAGVIVLSSEGKIILEGKRGDCRLELARSILLRGERKPGGQLQEILNTAKELFSDSSTITKPEPSTKATKAYNPFSAAYPNSVWKRITDRVGRTIRLEGVAKVEGCKISITAIPANLYNEAYFARNGFNKYLRGDNGGLFRVSVRILQ